MNCKSCNSDRIANVNAKCDDRCSVSVGDKESKYSIPDDMEIGGGDYVRFSFCLDCGKIKGSFPLEKSDLEDNSD